MTERVSQYRESSCTRCNGEGVYEIEVWGGKRLGVRYRSNACSCEAGKRWMPVLNPNR